MGRLTLNVLLSFAQFEREVTGERIRDKIAASKKKGIRMGGAVPLGFAGLSVALGVPGAGIAFALQEVIASVASWVAVSFGNFYSPGDRVQLGGIKGDVIDVGVLRTTLMEMGEWVNGDLYNGRIVRVANSFVFKEPVYNYSADFPFFGTRSLCLCGMAPTGNIREESWSMWSTRYATSTRFSHWRLGAPQSGKPPRGCHDRTRSLARARCGDSF